MKFDVKSLKLPFYPGDPLYWIDTDTASVRKEEPGIDTVVLRKDGIFFMDGDSSDLREPGCDDYSYLTFEEAQKALVEKMKQLPEKNYKPTSDFSWYRADQYLPPDGTKIIATCSDGVVRLCLYLGDDVNAFFNVNTGHECFVFSWKPCPEPDFEWKQYGNK